MDEFYKLPAGTLCMTYYDKMIIKEETIYDNGIPIDFFYRDMNEIIDTDKKDGTSFEVDFTSSERDGEYNDKRWWAVYEVKDISGLINVLNNCLYQLYEKELEIL